MAIGQLIVILAEAAALATAVAAPPTISKFELRSDPPAVTDKRLRDTIWEMFEHPDHRREKPPKNKLSNVFLQTKLQSTYVPGLCRYDSVQFEFEPVKRGAKGPDAQTRPVGVKATSWFTFISPPKDDFEAIVDYSARQPLSGCQQISRENNFFSAEDERDATYGYRAFTALQVAIRAGREFPLSCTLYPVDTKPCAAIIAAMTPEELESVERCDAESETLCYRLQVAGRLIDVTITGHVSPGPPPGEIVSAKLSSLIVMAHDVID